MPDTLPSPTMNGTLDAGGRLRDAVVEHVWNHTKYPFKDSRRVCLCGQGIKLCPKLGRLLDAYRDYIAAKAEFEEHRDWHCGHAQCEEYDRLEAALLCATPCEMEMNGQPTCHPTLGFCPPCKARLTAAEATLARLEDAGDSRTLSVSALQGHPMTEMRELRRSPHGRALPVTHKGFPMTESRMPDEVMAAVGYLEVLCDEGNYRDGTSRTYQRLAIQRAAIQYRREGLLAAGCFDDLHDKRKKIGNRPGNPHHSICQGGWLCPIHIELAACNALLESLVG